MSEAVLDQRSASALAQDLTRSFSGDVLTAGEPGYDEVRTIWNAMVDKRPALIARCASSGDVATSVNRNFYRSNNAAIAPATGRSAVTT
jgi:hypothetical protein